MPIVGTVEASNTVLAAAASPTVLRWWLKDPLNPAANMELSLAPGTLGTDSSDRQQVIAVLGRPDPVILSDAFGLPSITLTLVFTDDDSYQAFETLRSTQHILLLQGPYPSGQWYVRLGATKHDDTNLPSLRGWATNGKVVRTVQLTCQAVALPLDTVTVTK